MRDPETKLRAKEEGALTALLLHPSVRRASAAVKIPEPTLYRMLRDPAFRSVYQQRRRQALECAVTSLHTACGQAVETMTNLMTDENAPASTRLGAAKAVMELAIRGSELLDMEERLTVLETVLAAQGDKKT